MKFSLETLQSPKDNLQDRLLQEVGLATSSIYMQIYGFTLQPLVDLLLQKHAAGLDILCVFDHTQAMGTAEKPQVQRLIDAGIKLAIGTSPDSHQIVHEKCIVIDGQKTLSGSYNFSVSAQKQINHLDVIDSIDRANMFTQAINDSYNWIMLHEPQYQGGAK